jgi:hypothetical protein
MTVQQLTDLTTSDPELIPNHQYATAKKAAARLDDLAPRATLGPNFIQAVRDLATRARMMGDMDTWCGLDGIATGIIRGQMREIARVMEEHYPARPATNITPSTTH